MRHFREMAHFAETEGSALATKKLEKLTTSRKKSFLVRNNFTLKLSKAENGAENAVPWPI